MAALLGQTQMIYEMYDHPERMKVLAKEIEQVLIRLVEAQNNVIPHFHGGAALGFYHVWTPEKCMWFQEDHTALISPEDYKVFVRPHNEAVCSIYKYNSVHLHSSSFHVLDDMLSINRLRSIEINKDVGGLTVQEMVPAFNKVLNAGKKLILWGMLDKDDLMIIRRDVDWKRGVFLCIVTDSVEQAEELLEIVCAWE
jgi:hypothetical protein